MASITLRSSVTSALSASQYDATISALNNDKLDKVATAAQTVASAVTFSSAITFSSVPVFSAGLSSGTTIGTLTLADGSITDSGGAISFGNENVSTTGILSAPQLITASGSLTITPAASNNLDIVLGTTGDFTVNTDDLVVDTSTGFIGIGVTLPLAGVHIKNGTTTNAAPHGNANNLFLDEGSVTGMTISGTSQSNIYFGDAASSTVGRIYYNHGADALSFYTNTTQQILIDSGGDLQLLQGGINFPDTQNASSDVNTLDDYEEGTWTPELWDDTLATEATEPTYTTQVGWYTKIGNLVSFGGKITITALGSLTTSEVIRIGGLPFTANSTTGHRGTLNFGFGNGLNLSTATTSITGLIQENTAYATLYTWDVATGVGSMLVSEFSASGNVTFTGQYKV